MKRKKYLFLIVSLFMMGIACSCSSDDPKIVESEIGFSFTRNILNSERLIQDVDLINLWAIDKSGKIVWSTQTCVKDLNSDTNSISVPMAPGTYDFVAWCGLTSESPFAVLNPSTKSIEDLSLQMALTEKDGLGKVSQNAIPTLFHGIVRDVVVSSEGGIKAVIPLTRVSNEIAVSISFFEANEIDINKYTCYITKGHSLLNYADGKAAGEQVTYLPYNMETVMPGLVYNVKFSLSRIMADGEYELVIEREGREVLRTSLLDCLLQDGYELIKATTDQEYLDIVDNFLVHIVIKNTEN